MAEQVIYESLEGKRGVRITQSGESMQFLTMRNGFQWSGMPVDRDLLLRMHAAIESALESTAGVGVDGKMAPNFKCIYCGWVGTVNPSDPACGNRRCVEPYPGKGADGVGVTPAPERFELLAALTEAHEAIQAAGRNYGEVGTRDVDIADHNERMDRALLAISVVVNKMAPHVAGVLVRAPAKPDTSYPEGFDASCGLSAHAMRTANGIMASVTGKREWDVPMVAAALESFRAVGVLGARKCLYCEQPMTPGSECTSKAQSESCDVRKAYAPHGVPTLPPPQAPRLRDALLAVKWDKSFCCLKERTQDVVRAALDATDGVRVLPETDHG